MRSFCTSRLRAGWTLVEMMVVVAVIGVLSSITVIAMRQEPSPGQAVSDAAYALAHGIETIRTEALVSHSDARITTGGVAGDSMDVRFYRVSDGSTTESPLIADSKSLRETVRYGSGLASIGPTGDTIRVAAPEAVTCSSAAMYAAACYTGTTPNAGQVTAASVVSPITYYLTVSGHPESVRAIVISPQGQVTVYVYNPSTNAWN